MRHWRACEDTGCWIPLLECPIQEVWGGVRELVCLISSKVLVLAPYFEICVLRMHTNSPTSSATVPHVAFRGPAPATPSSLSHATSLAHLALWLPCSAPGKLFSSPRRAFAHAVPCHAPGSTPITLGRRHLNYPHFTNRGTEIWRTSVTGPKPS